MSSHWRNHLTLALALTLASACGDDKPELEDDVGSVSDGDDGEPADDVDAVRKDDAGRTKAPRDSGSPGTENQADSSEPPAPALDGGVTSGDSGKPDASEPGPTQPGDGQCCDGGNCLCHGPEPKALTSDKGPYATESYALTGTGCIYYPKDAEPPFAAVTVSDGFGGAGGCGRTQTDQWGPLYASWGIVTMIVNTTAGDQPNARGRALLKGIEAFKTENTKSGSPLEGKLAGRYGTSGFSMGGGGTTFASRDDKSLLTSVAIMPWGPVTSGISVPTLVICGSSDGTAPCNSHGIPAYNGIAESVPKLRVQVTSGHAGQPTAGSGKSGQYGLAFQKVFLEGDERWRSLLVGAPSEASTLK